MFILFTFLGALCLYIAPIKYDWMIEHEMARHAYAFAAISIFGEVVYLLLLRNGIVSLWRIFRDLFGEEK